VDFSIRIFGVPDGTLHKILFGHERPIEVMAFHPNNWLLASASRDGVLRIWNATQGLGAAAKKVSELGLSALAFSPDGAFLAAGGLDRMVHIWSVVTNPGPTEAKASRARKSTVRKSSAKASTNGAANPTTNGRSPTAGRRAKATREGESQEVTANEGVAPETIEASAKRSSSRAEAKTGEPRAAPQTAKKTVSAPKATIKKGSSANEPVVLEATAKASEEAKKSAAKTKVGAQKRADSVVVSAVKPRAKGAKPKAQRKLSATQAPAASPELKETQVDRLVTAEEAQPKGSSRAANSETPKAPKKGRSADKE
jgi:hypothetical protein